MIKEHYVLIVEDDPNDAFFIQRAFQQAGITRIAHVCTSMRDAINYLAGAAPYQDRRRFPVPNLLVTDLKMPGGSGLELLRWIRDHPEMSVIPTIVLSSSALPSDVKCAYCLGANAYLCKPTSPDAFKDLFITLMQFWNACEVPDPGGPTCQELIWRKT